MPSERAIVDAYTRRALLLLRVGRGLGRDAATELRKLAKELRVILGGASVGELGRRDLAALLREVDAAIVARYAIIVETQASELALLAEVEAGWAEASRRPPVGVPRATGLLVLGLPLARHWERQAEGLTDRIASAVRTAATTGQDTPALLATIVGQGRPGRERGGLMEGARQQAATLADTSAHAAAYEARQRAWESGGVRYLKWHSILDTRTTIGCAARAGLIYTTDFQPVNHDVPIDQLPPRHFNCRSLLAPMAPDFEPPGDGQDTYSESLNDWLKRQPEMMQDELLGPTRAALWRAGKLDARGLLGRDGAVLSVAELGALDTARRESVAVFVGRAAESTEKQAALALGRVPPSLVADIEGIGLRGRDKALALDHDNTRHILRGHGTGRTEAPRGQVPITHEDFARLPDILAQAGEVSRGNPPVARDGAPLVQKTVVFDGFHYEIILKIRRRDVVPLTLYKRPA